MAESKLEKLGKAAAQYQQMKLAMRVDGSYTAKEVLSALSRMEKLAAQYNEEEARKKGWRPLPPIWMKPSRGGSR